MNSHLCQTHTYDIFPDSNRDSTLLLEFLVLKLKKQFDVTTNLLYVRSN